MTKSTVILPLVLGVTLVVGRPPRAQDVGKVVEILEKGPGPSREDSSSQDDVGREAPAPPTAPAPLFYLRDNSKVAGYPRLESLDVRTRYGTLRVPVEELVTVRLVQRVEPEVSSRVKRLVSQLGHDEFDRREAAMVELRKIGTAALPGLRSHSKGNNEEIESRAQILIEEIEATEKKETSDSESAAMLGGTEDIVETSRMAIKGLVLLDAFSIDTRYGPLTVNVADVSTIAFRRATESQKKLKVLPSHQAPGAWLATKMAIEKGQKLRIEAEGVMQVSNYSVSCGPAGTTQYSGNSFGGFPMLSLVAKIGKGGKPFLVGSKHLSKTARGGDLYLAVVPFSFYPQGTQGSYTVRVRVGPDA